MSKKLDLTAEIQEKLLEKTYGFKQVGNFLRGGECPTCNARELWTLYDKPYYVKCPRENHCGNEWNIKEFLPELFANLNERYPATDENPNQTADIYLSRSRGLDIEQMHGWYEQGNFWRSTANKGTATVKFWLKADKSVCWERFVEEVIVTDKEGKKKAKKMDFTPYGCKYSGLWWQPPTLTIADNSEVIWTEGILDAISLYQNGHAAVAIMSAGNFPSEAIKPYLKRGITWVIGLDNDNAGRKHLQRHVEKLRELGETVSAVLSSDDSIKTDWNDLHRNKKLSAKHLQDYRLLGQIALAESKEEKAFYAFLQTNETRKHQVIDFNNNTYSVLLNKEKYDDDARVFESDPLKVHKIKFSAFKAHAAFDRIASFRVDYLYKQQFDNGNNNKYMLRLHFANRAPYQDISIPHTAFVSASKFKESLLAADGMFKGETRDVEYLHEKWTQHWKKTVKLVDFIGYDNGNGTKDGQGTKAYIFHDYAVQNGEVIKLNNEGYFSLKSGIGIKSGINAHYQQISLNEPVNFLPDFEQAFGTKGFVGLANLLGSLFAEQIRDFLGFYYFFELWDEKGGSGKSSLAVFLLKLLGRDLNEFNPNMGTATGRQRRFADTSNMPIVLNETDSASNNEKRFHVKKFDWDMDSKNLYDGMIGNSKGAYTNDNTTQTGRFRGALWVIQNTQVNAERSTLSRFVSMYFDTKHHSHAGHAATLRLKDLRKEDVSGFMIKALRNESLLLAEFKKHYHLHNKRLQENSGIKEQRIIDNHAHLLALIDCLPIVLPNISEKYLNAARLLTEKMAIDRERLLQKDHPVIIEFWQTFDELNSGILRRKRVEGEWSEGGVREDIVTVEEGQLDHSRDPTEIAISLVEYSKVCRDHGIPVNLSELRKQLILSKNPKYLKSNYTINSKVTGKSIKCMIFKKVESK